MSKKENSSGQVNAISKNADNMTRIISIFNLISTSKMPSPIKCQHSAAPEMQKC